MIQNEVIIGVKENEIEEVKLEAQIND